MPGTSTRPATRMRRAPAARSAAAVGLPAFGVEGVAGTEHRDRRACSARQAAATASADLGRARLDRVDPARGQQVAGERGPGAVGGERPERGQERRRARAGGGQHGVGAVAVGLERRRGPVDGQAAVRARPGGARRSTGFSARSGNSLTPVIGVRRVATAFSRAARTASTRAATQPGVERHDGAARRLDLLEERPPGAGEGVGERLHEPRAARRVDHPREVRLLDQQRLRVARDPPGERGGRAHARVERRDGDRVRTADACGEARRSCRAAGSRRGRAG